MLIKYLYFLVFRNYDPAVNPFETAREYTRALNATKLDRVFAKPFIASLDGHRDGVFCMCKHRKKLNTVFSGSCDGEVGYKKEVFRNESNCCDCFVDACAVLGYLYD